jgi:acyl-coenzyme A synthetase/AMP-(fatty) acid ligase
MQIYRAGCKQLDKRLIESYKQSLKKNGNVSINSFREEDHLAAFIAWKQVGGIVFVANQYFPKKLTDDLFLKIDTKGDYVVFCTSGTTGTPKLIYYNRNNLQKIQERSSVHLNWQDYDFYVNMLPPFTSGFWFLVLLNSFNYDTDIYSVKISDLDNVPGIGVGHTTLVPSVIDKLQKENRNIKGLEQISTGGSQCLPRHAEFCLNGKCDVFVNTYGATEIGAPALSRLSYKFDDYSHCLNKNKNCQLDTYGQLIFDKTETQDYFVEKTHDILEFVGRKNDVVSMNGFNVNLLDVENYYESIGCGEALARPMKKLNIDYIELLHTDNFDTESDSRLFRHATPLKFIKVSSIPRNSLGKKIRDAV